MGLSMADAIKKLDKIQTEAGLRDLISQLDVGCPGETTLLYSGDLSDGTASRQLTQQMPAGDNSVHAG